MCGRFTQFRSREDYLAYLGEQTNLELPFDPVPIARYNVAPGTKVLLLHEHDGTLHFDAVHWGYVPEWWHKPPLINARVETAATSRMFKPLWQHGRAIIFADGWYEWRQEGKVKQPYFIYREDGQPLIMAAIGRPPFDRESETEGFLVVTSAADEGLIDIHDRRPLVLAPTDARNWLRPELSDTEINVTVKEGAVPANKFTWHAVSRAVGNVKNQGKELIAPLSR